MKKINLDDSFKNDLIAKFTNYINTTKFTDNHIMFTTTIDAITPSINTPKPTIYISSQAYLKMMLYIRDTDVEIAWHGTVERNQEQNWYHIKDVFLYPQIIRSATVDTDQEKYQEWLQNIEDDEIFNNIRFQGHSHVNMGTTPSGTDLRMYSNFLQVLPKNDYYIFMIMNKSGSMTCYVYDLAKNLIYEPQDLNIKVMLGNNTDLLNTIDKEKANYCEKPVYHSFKELNAINAQARYYDKLLEDEYSRDMPKQKTLDINELLDEIDSKYKNPKLHTTKNKNKIKVKGGKK